MQAHNCNSWAAEDHTCNIAVITFCIISAPALQQVLGIITREPRTPRLGVEVGAYLVVEHRAVTVHVGIATRQDPLPCKLEGN